MINLDVSEKVYSSVRRETYLHLRPSISWVTSLIIINSNSSNSISGANIYDLKKIDIILCRVKNFS